MGAAAAVILMKERQVVDAFVRAGATSAASAAEPADLGVDLAGVGARRLVERAALRQTESGQWYLDLLVWEAVRRQRVRVLSVILLLVAFGALWLAGLFPPGAH